MKKDPAAPGPRVKQRPADQDLQRLLARGTPAELIRAAAVTSVEEAYLHFVKSARAAAA